MHRKHTNIDVAGKRALKSLTAVLDWLDNLIGLVGLLLVVSHPFAVPVLVMWAGLTNAK